MRLHLAEAKEYACTLIG